MARLNRWLDRVSITLGHVGCLLLLALVGLINVEIVLRYLFDKSTLVSDEYSGYLFVWLTLLGFGQALRSDLFLTVDVLVHRLGTRGKALCKLISSMSGLIVAVVTTDACLQLVQSSIRFGTVSIHASATPLWLIQIVLPFGMVWLCLLYLEILIRSGVSLFGGKL